MLDLIVEGPEPRQRLRMEILPDRAYVVGRDRAADVSVLWDLHISRRHVEIWVTGSQISVRKLDTASGPLFIAGRNVDVGTLAPGEHFVLGTNK